MKTLYFLRHAKSDWSAGLKDFDRPLNERGHRVAPKVGRELLKMDEIPQQIIASPAERTKQTAIYIAEGYRVDEDTVIYNEEIYEASTRTLLKVVNELPDDVDSIMIIGHNPSITYLSEYLTDEKIGNVPTCSVVKIMFSMDTWQAVSKSTGVLKWFLTPKQLGF